MKTDFVPRVNQLDALELDKDVIRIVRDQLAKALSNLSPGFLSNYQPELDLFLRTILWHYSIGQQSASFGQQLLFISYDAKQLTRSKLTLHFLLNVLLKYFRDYATFRAINYEKLQNSINWADNILVACNLLIFFRFLHTGKRPSIVDFILGIDCISIYGNRRRDVGYSHMTRELIWGGFMELLGSTLSLINYHYIKRKFRNFVSFSKRNMELDVGTKLPSLSISTKCAYCFERPTLPHHIGCGHVFCYYCLKGNVMADTNFQCPFCDASANEGIYPVIQFLDK